MTKTPFVIPESEQIAFNSAVEIQEAVELIDWAIAKGYKLQSVSEEQRPDFREFDAENGYYAGFDDLRWVLTSPDGLSRDYSLSLPGLVSWLRQLHNQATEAEPL